MDMGGCVWFGESFLRDYEWEINYWVISFPICFQPFMDGSNSKNNNS